ncbi:MAG: O-antigen ligase family protein [Rhodospirillaceae bacterium]
MSGGKPVGILFWAFLAILVLAPLPYGSVHLWSLSLLSLLVGALLAGWGLVALLRPEACIVALRHYGPPLALFVPVLLWIGVQAWPGVPEALAHPFWSEARTALGGGPDRSFPGAFPGAMAGTVSIDPDATLLVLMRLATYAGVFWLAMQLCADRHRASLALWAVAVAGFGYAAYGLWAYLSAPGTILFSDKWAYQLSLTGTLVNRGHYALYAGLGLVVSFAMMLRHARRSASGAFDGTARFFQAMEKLRLPVFLLLANCGIIGTALLLTESRGGLAFTAVALSAVALLITGSGRGRRRSGFAVIIGLFAGGIVLFTVSGDGFLRRLVAPDGSGGNRSDVYMLAVDAIAAAPLTGHGAGSFPVLFNLFRDPAFPAISSVYTEAHNVYLEFAAETGIVAAALYFAALVYIAATCFAATRRQRRHIVFPIVGCAAAILAGLHSLVDFGTQIPGVAVTLAALMGVGFGRSQRADKVDREADRRADGTARPRRGRTDQSGVR